MKKIYTSGINIIVRTNVFVHKHNFDSVKVSCNEYTLIGVLETSSVAWPFFFLGFYTEHVINNWWWCLHLFDF